MTPLFTPPDFADWLQIANAEERFSEANALGRRLWEAGIPLTLHPDHAAIFTDPPALVAGPLKQAGYVTGLDCRCYPSPVDGEDYINVAASLPPGHPARERGWWRHVAVVHPVDDAARRKMLANGYGNPFVHHLTFGIEASPRAGADDFEYTGRLIRQIAALRERIGSLLAATPGDLVLAVPPAVYERPEFPAALRQWLDGLSPELWQVAPMQGGGWLLQFFILKGGRIEVALRVDTTQVFNPRSVTKISAEEISTRQD